MSASSTILSEPGFAERTLADIASNLPGATAVFRRHKLDFCCGGQVSLREAAADKDRDLAVLEAELEETAAKGLPAELPEDTRDLIALIQTRYHSVHRQEFPELIRLAKRVEAVHRAHPAAPFGLAGLLEDMAREMEDHMQKEEQVLFPLMQRGGHPMIGQPIAVMLAEHNDHSALLRELEQVTNDHTVPEDACPTWRALYAGTRKLADDVMEHIHTENNVLFPRFT
jgi:regulator of cell morphogenesis and NO signaling